MDGWRRTPGAGRYAHPELERRFLVTGSIPAGKSRLIEDRYLDGARLRLRRVTSNGECVWKLTQKVRTVDADPATVSITNIYLSAEEYASLAGLPAATLVKQRTICHVDDTRFAIDVFEGQLSGLRLAEVEVDHLHEELPQPPWLGREVTHDDRFSGGRLARTSASQLHDLLSSAE